MKPPRLKQIDLSQEISDEERLVWEALLLRYPASPQSVDVQERLNNLK